MRTSAAAACCRFLVDGNTGFGGLYVVGHVVRMLESRGADGVSLEDKAFPRHDSFTDTGEPLALEDPAAYADRLTEPFDSAASPGYSPGWTAVCRRT